MRKKCYSFTLDESLVKELEDRNPTNPNRSFKLAQELESWFTALKVTKRELKQKLSKNEANLILDAMNSVAIERGRGAEAWMKDALLIECSECIEHEALDKKWGIEKDAFLKKLNNLSTFEIFVLADWAEKMWNLQEGSPEKNAKVWQYELNQFNG